MAYERPKRTVLLESGNPHRCTAVVFSRAHRPQSRIYDDPTLASLYRLVRAINEGAALGLIMPVWQSELGWSSGFISSAGAGKTRPGPPKVSMSPKSFMKSSF